MFKRVGLKMTFKTKELSWYSELKKGLQIPRQLGNDSGGTFYTMYYNHINTETNVKSTILPNHVIMCIMPNVEFTVYKSMYKLYPPFIPYILSYGSVELYYRQKTSYSWNYTSQRIRRSW